MSAYYNEHDAYPAQWLRNLIAAGHLPAGDVDERDIRDVRPDDLRGYSQCHFFAGIGGWPLALRMAGWADDRPVWSGSCPCQPFSAAGRGAGFLDERHLWPHWFHLVSQCQPPVLFGEQVASKDGLAWFDLVSSDLEGAGYAVGAADCCAAGVGAPHIRQRLWWVADAVRSGRPERGTLPGNGSPAGSVGADLLGNAPCLGCEGRQPVPGPGSRGVDVGTDATDLLVNAESQQVGIPGRAWVGRSSSPWSDLEWLPCRDGKWRPTRPGLQPLAHGVPARVGKLRAAGNAIVPQVAAEFIQAFLECRP